MSDQDEINRANLAGRLHPNQRRRVLAGSGPGMACFGIAVVTAVLYPISRNTNPWVLLVPLVVCLPYALWSAGRPVLELLVGRVRPITGWVHAQVEDPRYNLRMSGAPTPPKQLRQSRGVYTITIGNQSFKVDRELYSLVEPECDQIGFVTPWTGRLVNAIRKTS
ncbi:hypothetical protein F0L68_06550 [Solihabitans fulvus]|uniref:Uncharacterized protein n=1 Tax=Solihabitans fulvus TaxID=1892852 RepID=A0A5B2XNL8_9PSEU|nr:hypothetical protein [Solihabitans fulvus]KAA2264745.1 hypothetical protein F0L68_06550 [Solihabitans fulvus]